MKQNTPSEYYVDSRRTCREVARCCARHPDWEVKCSCLKSLRHSSNYNILFSWSQPITSTQTLDALSATNMNSHRTTVSSETRNFNPPQRVGFTYHHSDDSNQVDTPPSQALLPLTNPNLTYLFESCSFTDM